MIRPTHPDDTPRLLEIARGTGVFKPMEIVALQEVLDDYHALEKDHGHVAITDERDGQITGFAYYAPASMTDRSWYLYWIAVSKGLQAKGLGTELLQRVEDDVSSHNARLLLIETSSLPHYELTRRFYIKSGYDQVCLLKDFYADDDDLVVFGKRFAPRKPGA